MLNRLVEKKGHVINYMCLIVKQYIYAQRCAKKGLNFVVLKERIHMLERVEKYIAVKNFKTAIHNAKWNPILEKGVYNLDQYICQYNNDIG